jgi:PAS domain S-box-containing protein
MKGKNPRAISTLPRSLPPATGDAPAAQGKHAIMGRIHLAVSKEKSLPAPAPELNSQVASQLLTFRGRDIVLILSPTGKIIEANDAAIAAYQYDRDTLLSKHIGDLRARREMARLTKQLAEATKSGARFETLHRRADGSEFPVEVVSSSAVIGGEKVLLSVVRDIADRKLKDEQLEFQASLLNLSTEPIFAWYLDGEITYWNQGAENLYGFSREEAVGESSHRLLKTEHPQPLRDVLDSLRNDRFWRGELRQTTKSGQIVIVESRHQVLEEDDGRLLVLESNRDITERKRVEDSLRRSEERYRALTELSSEAIYVADREGRYILVNRRACELLGYTQAQLLSLRVTDVIVPREHERLERVREQLLAGKTDVSDWTFVRENGSEVSVEVSTRILPDGRWKALARDLTERKRAENQLRLSEERYRLTFDQAAVGIAHVSLDGRWLRVNQSLCEITGYSRDELLQMDFQSITHPEDLPPDLEQARRLIDGEIDHYGMEKRYIRRDGSTVWVDLSVSLMRRPDGGPDHFISVIANISERKSVEAELQERREELEDAQRVGGLGSWSWEPDLDRVQWSEELYRIAGLDPSVAAPAFGRQNSLYTPESWQRLQSTVQNALRTGGGYESDLEMVRPDGTHCWTAIRAEGDLDPQGRVRKLRGTVLDITERKRAEEALRKAHAELEDNVRERTAELAAVNQSLRVLTGRLLQLQDDERRRISRDLHDSAGQMLVALSMNCAALAREVNGPNATRLIGDTQSLISQMSTEIRTMSYLLHPPLLDEVGLDSALHWYVDGFSRRSGIETHLDVSPDFGRLTKEKEIAIFRVVQEALTNVLRHSGSATALVRVTRDQDKVRTHITDTGKGISAPRLAQIDNSSAQGVGLGGMRERIEQLGGEFTVASTDRGTEITATLPTG